MNMSVYEQLRLFLQLVSAMLIGGIIGIEREKDQKSAGIRTYATVCLGATLFTLVGNHMFDSSGASRVVSNIVVGIGFLGAGVIFRDSDHMKTKGLTTGATVWSTAAIGVAVGYELYIIAAFCAMLIYFLLTMHHFKWFNDLTARLREKHQREISDEHQTDD